MSLLALLFARTLAGSPEVRIRIHADQPTIAVSPSLYGIFFEEINQAGDGGLYAELLRGRGFEDGSESRLPTGWKMEGTDGEAKVDASNPLNDERRHSVRITRRGSEPINLVNNGFWGIPAQRGASYKLVLWSRGDVPLDVTLRGADGKALATTQLPATEGWTRYERMLKTSGDDAKASLAITPSKAGTAWVGFSSLTPTKTWKGHGLRPDLAGHVDDMNPAFVRFPGGCYVEGGDRFEDAFDWRRSVGPVEDRKGLAHSMWGYPNTFGLGYHEYLQWCEDMGSEPLFVVNCGINHRQLTPMSEMSKWVSYALDAIEYANGPTTSKWGALRAKNGHPKPFNLKYIEIGNENGGWFFGGNEAYEPRYRMIFDAIKAKHPEITTIADWRVNEPMEVVDEHYYVSPAWFWKNSHKYDTYDRKGPKIYVGEYAVTQGCGQGNLAAAIGEAAFMAGMERNSDVVHMASYAPLFVNVNNRQWNPNAIVFDNKRSYGTPSYWNQWLFSNNRPDRLLKCEVEEPKTEPQPLSGGVGIQTWRTQAEFKNIELDADGKSLFRSSDLTPNHVEFQRGDWKLSDGILSQSSLEDNRRAMLKGVEISPAKKVTLHLQARKTGGDEGFIIMMGVSPQREFQWNLGGWGNTVHAFQADSERTGKGVQGKIETGRWYDIRLEREGAITRAYLDGKLVEQIEDRPAPDFTATVGVDEKRNEIVIKAVNGSADARQANLDIRGAQLGTVANGYVLTSKNLNDENSLDAPEKIRPRQIRIGGIKPQMKLTLAPYSVTVLRIPRRP